MRYIIHEGYVVSSDGDEHFISGERLIELYNLDPSQCYIQRYDRPIRGVRINEEYTHLFPRTDGNYKIPGEKK